MAHTLTGTLTGVIGNRGFTTYTDKNGNPKARVDLGVHPAKDQTVWYTVFCTEATRVFITEKCGYGPGDTILVEGKFSSSAYKEIQEQGSDGNMYKKTVLECTVNATNVEPVHKKLAKPSEIPAAAPAQVAPAPQQTAPAQVAPAPQQAVPPQTQQTFAEAQAAVAGAAPVSMDDLPL